MEGGERVRGEREGEREGKERKRTCLEAPTGGVASQLYHGGRQTTWARQRQTDRQTDRLADRQGG